MKGFRLSIKLLFTVLFFAVVVGVIGVNASSTFSKDFVAMYHDQVNPLEELKVVSNANAAEEITETIIELSRISSETNDELKMFNIYLKVRLYGAC